MDTPETVTVIIAGIAGDHCPALNINGQAFPLAFNTPVELPAFAYEALKESTYGPVTTIYSPPDSDPAQVGDGDGAAADAGGGSGGTETFDSQAVLTGNVKDVLAKLDALTADELAAVQEAESARAKPRASVLNAIAAAHEALTSSTSAPAENQE